MTSVITGPTINIYPDTTIPGTAAVPMTAFKAFGNSADLIVTTTTGGCVSLTFTCERMSMIAGVATAYADVIDSDSVWSMVVTTPTVAGVYAFPLVGLKTTPTDYYRLSYTANTAAGKVKVDLIGWDNPAGGGADVSIGDVIADMGDIDTNTAASAASLAIIDDAVGTHDVAAAALLRGIRLLGNATSALQTAVTAANDDAKINTDLSGQVRLASHVIADIADSGKEIDPISSHYSPATILFSDPAVVLDPGASYAPDAAGHALTYGHQAAIQIYLRGGTGGGPVDRTVTVTIEGSMGLLIAAAVRWVDVSKSVLDLNTGLSNVASWTSTGVTATEYLLSLGSVPFSHFRVKYDWSGDPDASDGIIVVNAFKSAL